jgi:hypothetical protein
MIIQDTYKWAYRFLSVWASGKISVLRVVTKPSHQQNEHVWTQAFFTFFTDSWGYLVLQAASYTYWKSPGRGSQEWNNTSAYSKPRFYYHPLGHIRVAHLHLICYFCLWYDIVSHWFIFLTLSSGHSLLITHLPAQPHPGFSCDQLQPEFWGFLNIKLQRVQICSQTIELIVWDNLQPLAWSFMADKNIFITQ